MIFLGFNFIRHLFFVLGAFLEDQRTFRLDEKISSIHTEYTPRVSILVPAYNEEKVIASSLSHLANIRYPNFEIIVIDDGSHDQTYQFAITTASQLEHAVDIKVYSKKNEDKAAALNYGFHHTNGELILCVDADSRIHSDSLLYGVQHFKDPLVGAVAGYVEIENPRNLLEQFQQLEYMIGLNFTRKAYSLLGIVPVIPGPVALFRRETMEDVRGLTEDRSMFAEDAEMSLRVLSSGWFVRNEHRMIAYTEAPHKISLFLRQRYRWNRGSFQALSKNFLSMLRSKSHLARFLAVHLYVEIWVIPLLNISVIINFIMRLAIHQEVNYFTVWFMFSIFLDLWVLIAASTSKQRFFWAVKTFILSKLFYDSLLLFWRPFCMYDEWRAQPMTWDKLERSQNLNEVKYG